jgi:hypothetical protein
MKKNYLKPEMEVVEIKFESDLMAASAASGENPSLGGGNNDDGWDDSKPHNPSDNESIWD